MSGAELARCTRAGLRFGRGAGCVIALDEVSCAIGPGAHLAVVGPSGSGKSSLLHLMAGLERPTAGTVSWPALHDRPVGAGRVAVVFQAPSLIPELDAAENVGLPLLLAGHRPEDAQARALGALASVGLTGQARALPEELSGGQAQRVAVARALAGRPRLLLADEPTGQLDRATGAQMVTLLLATAEELGAGLVIATHDPAVAARLPRRWRMRDGRILASGDPLDQLVVSEVTS